MEAYPIEANSFLFALKFWILCNFTNFSAYKTILGLLEKTSQKWDPIMFQYSDLEGRV
jgi:hypothetical protein